MTLLIRDIALATGFFELGAVRVRGLKSEVYTVADDLPENGFIHLSLRLGAGRSDENKQQIGDSIFNALQEFLAAPLATEHFALSFEIVEINPALSYKRNAIHPRIRNTG